MSKLVASAHPRALLALADGTLFEGFSFGAPVVQVGEVVFNTSLSGYQEICTDPSYAKQIVTLTYPHIGNVGCNNQDEESAQVHLSGLVIRDLPPVVSNFRSTSDLSSYLNAQGVPGIYGIDTRKLTRILREKGAQAGCLMTENAQGEFSAERAVALAQDFPGLSGMDLAKVVTCASPHEWIEGEWTLGAVDEQPHFQQGDRPLHVVAYDFGVKRNILRMIAQRGCRVTVVPAQTPASDVLAMNPDGVFLSNGPGDPEPCDYAIHAIQTILNESKIPVFGICLGHQLLALASGAKTMKMKFGHHGANHPVQDLTTRKVAITSQNHGFAVDPESLPEGVKVTHVSLFDQSIQGIELTGRSAFSFQGHPEASPGPHDLADLFDRFVGNMRAVSA